MRTYGPHKKIFHSKDANSKGYKIRYVDETSEQAPWLRMKTGFFTEHYYNQVAEW